MSDTSEAVRDWFRPLFEQSPIAIQVYAPDGRLVRINRSCEEMWGVGAAQIGDYNVFEDEQLIAHGLMPHIRRGFAGEIVAIPPLRYDPNVTLGVHYGRPRWVRAFLYPVRDPAGAITAVVFTYEDITDQVVAEERLREREQQDRILLEQRVAERTRELVTLLEVSRNVVSTLDLDSLLGLILDQCKQVVDYTAVAIVLRENADELCLLRYQGPHAAPPLRWPLAQSPHREVFRRRAPVILADVQADTELARVFRAHQSSFPAVSATWMAVPLMVREEVIGLLSFEHGGAGYYTDHHADLALAFANQAAVAIENARLYAQAQHLAALEERQRLARELHDSVSQALYGISLGTRTARTLLDRDPARLAEPLDYILALAEAGLAEMRALIFALRPESLETEGLAAALRKQAAALRARHIVEVVTELCAEPLLPLEHKEALYRIAQEALHNTAKHACASRVTLRLTCDEEAVTLTVQDDGVGFDPDGDFPGHLGLHSMRERAERLHGSFNIASAPGAGARISARIPLPHRSNPDPA